MGYYIKKKNIEKIGLISIYNALKLPENKNYIIVEIQNPEKFIINITDVYFKILVPAKIFNPFEIIDIIENKNDNSFDIVLPEDYTKKDLIISPCDIPIFLNSFYDKNKRNIDLTLFYGLSNNKNYMLFQILKIYFIIKKYKTFTFYSLNQITYPEKLFASFTKFLNIYKSIINYSNDTQKNLWLYKIESSMFFEKNATTILKHLKLILKEHDITILINNFNFLPKNQIKIFFQIFKEILKEKVNHKLHFIFFYNEFHFNLKEFGLDIKKADETIFIQKISIKNFFKRNLIIRNKFFSKSYELNPASFEKLIIDSGYTFDILPMLIHYFDIQSDKFKKLNSKNSNEILEIKVNLNEVIKYFINENDINFLNTILILSISEIPLTSNIISFILKIPEKKINEILKKGIDKYLILRFFLKDKFYYTPILNFYKYLDCCNKAITKNNIYEKLGDIFLLQKNNLKLSLHFYIKSKNKNKTLTTLFTYIEVLKELSMNTIILNEINKVIKHFDLTIDEYLYLILEKLETLYMLGEWDAGIKLCENLLSELKEISSRKKSKIYYYLIEFYNLTGNIQKSTFLLKGLKKDNFSDKYLYYRLEISELDNLLYRYQIDNFLRNFYVIESNIQLDNTLSIQKKYILLSNLYLRKVFYHFIKKEIIKCKKAISYCYKYTEFSQKLRININIFYSLVLIYEGNFNEAINILSQTFFSIIENDNKKYLSDIYSIIAYAFFKNKYYTKSLMYYKKALELKIKINEKISIGIINYIIGVIHKKISSEKGEKYILKAKKLLSELGMLKILSDIDSFLEN